MLEDAGGLEKQWGLKFFDTELWTLDYLQNLAGIFSGMGKLIGGDDVLRSIVGASAQAMRQQEFYVYGQGDCGVGAASCSNYGYMRFLLGGIFDASFHTWGPIGNFYGKDNNMGKIVMGHELGHIVLGIAGAVDSHYRSKAWTGLPFMNKTMWLFSKTGQQMIGDPGEQLVQLMGIYLAGNGWQGLNYTQAGNQISGEDFATIDRLKRSVPEALQVSWSLRVFLKE